MPPCRLRSLSILAIMLGAAPPVMAAPPSLFVTRLMGRTPHAGKTFACFARVYDDAHLAAHAGQNVRSLRVLAVAYSTLDYAYQLRMGFEFRGRAETLTSVAECGPAHEARNSARCSGPIGASTMSLSLPGHGGILMSLPEGAHLWKPGPAKPDDTVNDAFGPDDRLFRLERTRLSRCDDQAIDSEEKALLDRDR